MEGYQWYGVKPIKSYFRELRELWKKVWGTSLLPQVVLISSIKPISRGISLMSDESFGDAHYKYINTHLRKPTLTNYNN